MNENSKTPKHGSFRNLGPTLLTVVLDLVETTPVLTSFSWQDSTSPNQVFNQHPAKLAPTSPPQSGTGFTAAPLACRRHIYAAAYAAELLSYTENKSTLTV